MVQWLRLCAPNAGGMGSIPSWGNKIPHAIQCSQKQNQISQNKPRTQQQNITTTNTVVVGKIKILQELSKGRDTKLANAVGKMEPIT